MRGAQAVFIPREGQDRPGWPAWRRQRWSRELGAVVKVDQLVRDMIQNDETKEPFVPLPGSRLLQTMRVGFQGQGCA
jgi:hypothetical protein